MDMRDDVLDDREVVLAACNQDERALRYASAALKGDREMVLAACNQFGLVLPVRVLVLRVLRASPALKGDREVVLAVCTKYGLALRYASAALKGDREVVLAACTQSGKALEFASAALKADREVVRIACTQDGFALKWASVALQHNREVVLAACNQEGWALQYASDALRDDREVVLAACNQNGYALEYASVALLKDDREVVMVAMAQDLSMGHRRYLSLYASVALRVEFEGNRIVTHVRDQLRLRSSFFGPFLCGIALPRPEAAAAAAPGGARCLLPRLDIGEEKPIQQLIAEFTGVPIGSSWRFLQLAAAHLTRYL